MPKSHARFALLVTTSFLLLALAGCTGGGDAGPDDLATPGVSDDGAASIRGLIVDDTELPVAGAQAVLQETGAAVVTDDAGRFEFTGLEAGAYVLFVQKLGFESLGKRLQVGEGEVVDVTVALAPIPVAEPWHQTVTHTGHIDLAVRYEIHGGTDIPVINDQYGRVVDLGSLDFSFEWEAEDRPDAMEAMFVEMTWEDTQMLSGSMRLRVETADGTNDLDRTFCVIDALSPATCAVNATTIQSAVDDSGDCDDEECVMQWRAFTGAKNTNAQVDFGVMYDQDFTGWVTMFYRQPMPVDYAARPDA